MLKLQVTYTTETEFKRLLYFLEMREAQYKVKPPENEPSRVTRGGNKIRWIDIKQI